MAASSPSACSAVPPSVFLVSAAMGFSISPIRTSARSSAASRTRPTGPHRHPTSLSSPLPNPELIYYNTEPVLPFRTTMNCFYIIYWTRNRYFVFVFTSFILHGTGTALSDDNGRTLVTTAPLNDSGRTLVTTAPLRLFFPNHLDFINKHNK